MITEKDGFCLRAQVLFDGKRESAGGLPPTVLVTEEQRVGRKAPEAAGWQNVAPQVGLKITVGVK